MKETYSRERFSAILWPTIFFKLLHDISFNMSLVNRKTFILAIELTSVCVDKETKGVGQTTITDCLKQCLSLRSPTTTPTSAQSSKTSLSGGEGQVCGQVRVT